MDLPSPKVLILGAIALSIALNIPAWMSNTEASKPAVQETRDFEREERDRARRLRAESRIAIERFKAGCIEVKPTGDKRLLLQGGVVVTTAGELIQDGTPVCHERTTAVIQSGSAQKIARVSIEDAAEYAQIRRQIQDFRESQND